MKKVILVSTCTNIKTAHVADFKKLQNCKSSIFDRAVNAWCDVLWSTPEDRIPAKELYAGNHWGETLKAFTNLSGREGCSPELWVLSAGCGLIPAELPVSPYSATFSSGLDGISELIWQPGWSPKERAQYWWKGINQGKPAELPKTLVDIDAGENSLFLFVLSKEYMPAVEQELFELISAGRQVLIVSAGGYAGRKSLHPILRARMFPLSEKFETYRSSLHGSKVALNANFAHWLTVEHLDELLSNPDGVLSTVAKIEQSLPDPSSLSLAEFVQVTHSAGSDLPAEELEHVWTKRNRVTVPMTDEEVLAYIHQHYEPGVSSATKLLRKLRHEELRSCEQKRFGALFKNYENRNQLSLFDE